ncbi:MAG: isoprenylcysteine carboxylmethyltransferase family protein [Acidobacteria bacterium]|nr:isoprenylcysteine carboxylmethyltransferase family protein [Acidobacteriota bacterium]
MDVLLVALHVLFFGPVIARLVRRPAGASTRNRSFAAEIVRGARTPALLLHGGGLVLLWAGVGYGVAQAQVARAVTTRGLVGAVLLICAVLLMTRSFVALRSWRLLPAIEAGHELCTAGPYAVVRHPMYLAIDLLGIGSAVWVGATPVLAAAVLLVVGGDLRARREEQALLAAFGERYRRYMARVARLIPFVY